MSDIISILSNNFSGLVVYKSRNNDVVAKIDKSILINVSKFLIENETLKFDQLVDLCGVDYLRYKKSNWNTSSATSTGFSRGQMQFSDDLNFVKDRFAVVYNLLSYKHNHRIRLHVLVSMDNLSIPSVTAIWPTANWHEREVYDFFGIVFEGHPNLVRILTDYDFQDYPLRKDFPVTGKHEIRYDSDKKKLVYEPTRVKEKINSPKISRIDLRYK